MLNKRHKVILFVTVVMTGSALLAGVRLNEALGMLMLGGALAWLVGGELVLRIFNYLGRVPSKSWPWVRLLLLMAIAGLLLEAVALWSHFNSFLVITCMSVFGIIISPIGNLPTQKVWLKVIFWIIAVTLFFLATVSASIVGRLTGEEAERLGQLAAYGLIALPVGMLWLVKGYKLVVAGLRPELAIETEPTNTTTKQKSVKWLYLSLALGVLILTLILGLGTFSAFSDSAFPVSVKTPKDQTAFSQVAFLMLLAWWPYACWKTILRREPNSERTNLLRHTTVTVALAVVFTIVICVGITFGIQNGNDRMSTAQIEQSEKDFRAVASKIGRIKSRDLKTTADYINAYEEIEPLLADYDGHLQRYTQVITQAQERYKNRGPLNIQRLYRREKEWLDWDLKMFDLLRQDSQLTRKQVDAVKQMGELPEQHQAEFWEENVRPLLGEEDGIRQRVASLQATKPSP